MKLVLFAERTIAGDIVPGDSQMVIEGVEWVHQVYRGLTRVRFYSIGEKEAVEDITGWEDWDEDVLEMSFFDDMVSVKGRYFADWSIDE